MVSMDGVGVGLDVVTGMSFDGRRSSRSMSESGNGTEGKYVSWGKSSRVEVEAPAVLSDCGIGGTEDGSGIVLFGFISGSSCDRGFRWTG